MKRRKKPVWIIAILLLLAGIIVLLYPAGTDWLYKNKVQSETGAFEKDIVKNDRLNALHRFMKKENKQLFVDGQKNLKDPFSYQIPGVDISKYGLKDNVIGYIIIPSIKVTLPIRLGANDANMNEGAVHLTQTSYPVGGKSTNSVIAAHRGYWKTDMFRHIEKIKVGDLIGVKNFRENLTYRVTKTKIIDPTEIDQVLIQSGKDMITLVTCNPLGDNYQRYLVYCERTFDKSEEALDLDQGNKDKIKECIKIALLIICILIMTFSAYKIISNGVKKAGMKPQNYKGILNKEELDLWENSDVRKGKAFLQLNTRIPVSKDGRTARLRLINPPYCEFSIKVTMSLKGEEKTTLYQSDMIDPGSIVLDVKMSESVVLDKEADATVDYHFYDSTGTEQGTYAVDVKLVKKTKKNNGKN